MAQTHKSKTVIYLSDNHIKYLTLSKNNYGFYIENYDSADLDKDILKNGEVLKADFLIKILKKIHKKVQVQSIDLILPHDYFFFDLHTLAHNKKLRGSKLLKKYLKENKSRISWAATHAYEYDLFEQEKETKVLFRAIPQDIYFSYNYVFKKAGFKIRTIQSDIVSFSHLMKQQGRVSQIFVGDTSTYILEYEDGIFESDKKFSTSYYQFIQDIKKNVRVSDEEAKKILTTYGVLKAHKDKKVLAKIERSMHSIFDFLRKRKIKKELFVYVHFAHEPIRGFSDRLRRFLHVDIYDLCVLCTTKYTFQDVLTLHKKDSYEYEPLIARALAVFKEK